MPKKSSVWFKGYGQLYRNDCERCPIRRAQFNLIVHDRPLYVYARDFDECPELYHQLEVIKNLKIGDIETAQKFWSMLTMHNPELYKSEFEYKGDETLFFQALKLHLLSSNKVQIQAKDLAKFTTNLAKLDYIFSHAQIPMSQSDIIKLIWNEEVSESGKAKLRRLISDYSKKFNKKIKAYQSTYQIDKKAS
jgi:hypothetical protein